MKTFFAVAGGVVVGVVLVCAAGAYFFADRWDSTTRATVTRQRTDAYDGLRRSALDLPAPPPFVDMAADENLDSFTLPARAETLIFDVDRECDAVITASTGEKLAVHLTNYPGFRDVSIQPGTYKLNLGKAVKWKLCFVCEPPTASDSQQSPERSTR